ncbi:hypothetical protein ACTXT7_000511 [Hymenolepis weldensis]
MRSLNCVPMPDPNSLIYPVFKDDIYCLLTTMPSVREWPNWNSRASTRSPDSEHKSFMIFAGSFTLFFDIIAWLMVRAVLSVSSSAGNLLPSIGSGVVR